jgi:hypothetical protein
MGKVKELHKQNIIEAASHYLCAEDEESLYDEYLRLKNAEEQGNEYAPAINYASVWQPIEYKSVKEILDLIEEGIQNAEDDTEHPAFMQNMDWELLKQQKKSLLEVIENTDNVPILEHLEGLLGVIDAVQDYAVDVMGLDENVVMDLSKEDE